MRIAVCESPPALYPETDDWRETCRRVRAVSPDVFVLNEMPFGPWIAVRPSFDSEELTRCLEHHRTGMTSLGDLGAAVVLGSEATLEGERSVNQGYVWRAETGAVPVHTKQFFPDEEGYYEARWWRGGERRFQLGDAGGIQVGLLLCTDVMFLEWARYYGRTGAHLIAVPRATPAETVNRWRTVMQAAAIVSGCYVASSNRVGTQDGLDFAGRGWIVHPSGDVIAETSPESPVVAAELDLAAVSNAQRE